MADKQILKHENPALLVILLIVTCGIYYLILLYRWIMAINDASEKSFIDPTVAVVLSIVTCGIAPIYFEYEIVSRAEKIARQPLPEGIERSTDLSPPIANLKEIVLFGNIAVIAIGISSSGLLSVIPVVFTLWLTCTIQNALEYAFAIPQD